MTVWLFTNYTTRFCALVLKLKCVYKFSGPYLKADLKETHWFKFFGDKFFNAHVLIKLADTQEKTCGRAITVTKYIQKKQKLDKRIFSN